MKQKTGKRSAKRGNGAIDGATKKAKRSSGKSKKFKSTRLFKILRFALFFLIIVLIVNIIIDLAHKAPKKVSVVVGDKKIELAHDVLVDKYNNIFMSIDDVKNLYDKNIYYSNNILITTYNKHIAVLEKEKTTMKVNDVVQEIKGTLKETNGTIYLPLSDMADVYDFADSYNKDTKVLSLDSKLIEKKESVVLKNVSLKAAPGGFFTKTLEKVKKTSFVTVFGTDGDYTKVRTKSGNVGYVKTNKLSEPETLWETMDEEKIEGITILSDYSIVDSRYEVLENAPSDSVVLPNLFNITEVDGNVEANTVINLEGDRFITYKDWANVSNVNICPTVTLSCGMSKVCSSYESRSYVINTLYNNLVSNGLRMICVDFEELDDIEGLYRFVTEMVPRFKCAGMKVLIKYNNSLNKDRLNNIVDYVID